MYRVIVSVPRVLAKSELDNVPPPSSAAFFSTVGLLVGLAVVGTGVGMGEGALVGLVGALVGLVVGCDEGAELGAPVGGYRQYEISGA